MKRAAFVLAIAMVLVSCATMEPRGQALVGRAVQAMGGAEALAGVKTLSMKGTVRQWEPEQSMTRRRRDALRERVDVRGRHRCRQRAPPASTGSRNFAYPAPRTFTFSEIVTPDGRLRGRHRQQRPQQAEPRRSNPPAHSMSGLRLATTQRELRRGSAVLLLEMLRNPDRVTAAGDVTVAGVAHPAVDYRVGDHTLIVDVRSAPPGCRRASARSTTTTSGAT